MRTTPQPSLESDRIYLRPLEESDLTEEYLSWLNDPAVTHHLDTGRFPETYARMHRWLEKFQSGAAAFAFAIIDKATNRHIGNITLCDANVVLNGVDDGQPGWEHRTVIPGIMIGSKEFWGKGYGTEAQHIIIDYAFNHLGAHKIVHTPLADNIGSFKMAEKLGLRVEGILRKQDFIDGKFRDVIMMGMFKEDYVR